MIRPQYIAHINAEGIAVTTPYVLVDLSDTTNYKHTKNAEIQVLAVFGSLETKSSGVFDVYFGSVVENDATDGTAVFFDGLQIETQGNPTDSTSQLQFFHDYTLGGLLPNGISLSVVNGALSRITSLNTDANVRWQNDTNIITAATATGRVGVGDFVMLAEEVTDGGTLDISVTVIYTTA